MTISMIVPLIAFFSYCALLLVTFRSPRTRVTKVFAVYLVVMMLWSLSSFMMRTGLYPGPKIWNQIMVWGMIGVPFVFYHFSREILSYQRLAWTEQLGYVFYLIFALTNLFGLIVTDAYLTESNFVYQLGPGAAAFAAVAAVYQLSSVTLLLRSGIKDPTSFWTNHLIYPSIGSILVLIGSLLNFFPLIGQYPVDIAANLINAFLLAFAIFRYRLLNITITIRRAVVYSILTVMISSSYVLLVLSVDRAMGIKARHITLVLAIPMAALIAFYFDPAKETLRVWTDKVFLGSQYDYKQTLRDFSQLMTSILDLDELAQSTLQLVGKALQTSSGVLLLLDVNGNYYPHSSFGLDSSAATAARIDKTSPIIRWLAQQEEPLILRQEMDTRPEFRGLWQKEKQDLQLLSAEILVGIKMREELIGLLMLPNKSSGDPLTDDDRELILTLANEAAVAIQNAQTYAHARTQAVRDELTKLYNYRFFHDCLDKEITVHEQANKNFAIILMDLDLFKAYNDIYGHLFGDEALVKVAQAITDSIRATDVAARYGGDEFAVILPATNQNQVWNIAQRIKDTMRHYFPGVGEHGQLLTMSLGVAVYPDHGTSKQRLLAHADQALYQSKRAGRNRVSGVLSGQVAADQNEVEATVEAERDFLMKQVEDAYLATIYTLAAAINARDNYTYEHSEMVTRYALTLAEALGLSEEQKKIIHHAAMLHDIGKIGVPEYILNKPGPLIPVEREAIENHVNIADAIISQMPYLRGLAPIIRHHHEAYDGTGYPSRLQGETIPLEARILAIADAYHAMTSDRPYRRALSKHEAQHQLIFLAGKQFDPALVPLFVRTLQIKEQGSV